MRNEVKMKTKQTKDLLEKIKEIYQKLGKQFAVLSKWQENVNVLHAP